MTRGGSVWFCLSQDNHTPPILSSNLFSFCAKTLTQINTCLSLLSEN